MKNKKEKRMIFLAFIFFLIVWILLVKIISKKFSTQDMGCFLVTKFNDKEIGYKGRQMKVGECSISQDIYYSGLLNKGEQIKIAGLGTYTIKSLMDKRDAKGNLRNRIIDIYTSDIKEARTHGAVRRRVYLIKEIK
jgi:hypothetical protein